MSVGRHILELNASNNAVVRSYVWGLDLSGTLDGAGGVGGLLWVTINSGPAAGTHYCCYDGNGNVVSLVSATTGTETARDEYGSFGEPIRVTGPASRSNPFRFSAKRTDDTTDLVLYEYRAYSSTLGRWLSRDPIGELGVYQGQDSSEMESKDNGWIIESSHQYCFVLNAPVSHADKDGCRLTPDGDIPIGPTNRLKPPNKMILIKVPRCTILFIYGHNYVTNFNKEGLQWIWNIVPESDNDRGCAYAAVAGCSANLVPNEISLPGFNYADYDVAGLGVINGLTLLQMWRDVRTLYAPAAAQQICEKCGCKEVVLKTRKVGKIHDLEPEELKFPCKCQSSSGQ